MALRAETDKIILGGMGMTNDDYLYFKNVFSNAGALDRIISFVNTTENPPVERLLIPDMALTAAEYFAVEHNQKVLVLLTDMIRIWQRYTKRRCSSRQEVPLPLLR